MKFSQRRSRNSIICVFTAVTAWWVFDIIDLSLEIQQYYSGWFLVSLITILLAFYLRKRLRLQILGSSSSWAQWHYYTGIFLALIFLEHVEFSFPNGLVETTLTLLLLTVIFSGMVGVMINRHFARRLASLDEEVIFERIGVLRQQLKTCAETLILDTAKASNSKTLSNYYVTHLVHYFSKPRFIFSHIFGSHYAYICLRQQLEKQLRYFNREEAEAAVTLFDLMKKKNTLDIHTALQGVLKYWGLLHLPFAWMMLLMLLLHIILVYAFRGAV
jgi:hypothetical protein